jgi:DNA-binding CsgD family transcriptional regulator
VSTAAVTVHGRETELDRLRGLVRAAREGRGDAVVVLGEAGMGRTTLVRSLRSESSGVRMLGFAAVAAEHELPLSGLHRLLEPVARHADALPGKLAEALSYVAGRSGVPDQYLLCCGVHRLLAGLAASAPILCWVDDAHWLDPLSLEVLAFTARRVTGRRLAVVLTGRPELAGRQVTDGIEPLWLAPLAESACDRLLRDRLPRRIPAGLRAILVEQAAGNPADLLELAASLDPDQLAGRTPLPEVLPAGDQRARYRARLAALSPAARQAVLVAAVEPDLDAGTLRRCATGSVLREASDSGLLGDFPLSPVVRATLYAEASATERLAAHAVLASVLDGDRRVWHRAMSGSATPGLAEQLTDAARQSDHATASHRWERAAILTVDSGLKGERLLEAARQAWHAGQAGRARGLLAQARAAGSLEATLLHGEIELRDGEPALASHALMEASDQLRDPAQAAVALMLAGEARRISGDLPGYASLAARVAKLSAPTGEVGRQEPLVELATAHFAGVAATFDGRYVEAAEPLARAIRVGRSAGDVRAAVWAAGSAFALGQVEEAHECASAAVSRARLTGESALLPWALVYLALSALVLDRHRPAVAAALDGLAAATRVAQRNCAVQHLTLLALSAALLGDRELALSRLDEAAPEIADRGLGRPSAMASWAYACLDLAADRPADALGRFDTMGAGVGVPQLGIRIMATPQVVEAAVRCGRPERGARALRAFDRWIAGSDSPHWQALSKRCHALLAEHPDTAERHFRAAIELHRNGGAALELARTQLAYAQRLRRDRKPAAARDLLREAVRIFRSCGADTWAEQAKAQLRAAGAAIPQAPSSLAGLTPQQATISRLVAAGETNREIARRLVISHRTVDHHLRNIFATLGVRSRVELTRRVATLEAD